MTGLAITALAPGYLAGLAEALDAANLPTADLAEPGRTFFRFNAGGLVGYGGLEGETTDRLIRSVVILPERRALGLGRALVTMLEQEARHRRACRLHLLTTTAAPFFRILGYADADRRLAPPAVASSREFTALCPASAVYLTKAL